MSGPWSWEGYCIRANNFSLRVEIIDTADNSQIWGEQYNGRLTDMFAAEKGISKEIVDNLRLKLTSAEETELSKSNTESPEAYQHYLKGRYFWNSGTMEGLKNGIEQFQRAIEMDPGYADAYAGLAYCFIDLGMVTYMPSHETLPQGKAAALKALELDDSLAEAHAAVRLDHMDLGQGQDRCGKGTETRDRARSREQHGPLLLWLLPLDHGAT